MNKQKTKNDIKRAARDKKDQDEYLIEKADDKIRNRQR
jgi:hypothetical protein